MACGPTQRGSLPWPFEEERRARVAVARAAETPHGGELGGVGKAPGEYLDAGEGGVTGGKNDGSGRETQ